MHYRGRAYLGRIAGIEAMSPSPDSFHNLSLLSVFSLFQSTLLSGHSSAVKGIKKANENAGQAGFSYVSTFITSSLQSLILLPLPVSPFLLPSLSLSVNLVKLFENSPVDMKN